MVILFGVSSKERDHGEPMALPIQPPTVPSAMPSCIVLHVFLPFLQDFFHLLQ